MFTKRLISNQVGGTLAINSTTYVIRNSTQWFYWPEADPGWNRFRISARGTSSQAGQTVTAQLATEADPSTPLGTLGDDLVMDSVGPAFVSDVRTLATNPTPGTLCALALKGSNSTVDWTNWTFLDIEIWKA